MANIVTKKEDVSDVVVRDAPSSTVSIDSARYSRIGWFVVLFGVFGFILWAVLAPLDKGVPMSATVMKESNRKTIQHLTGGTVEEILVHDGDVVKAGQVLLRMNNVAANTQLQMVESQYFTVRLSEARLLAERDGNAVMAFPAALAPYKNDVRVQSAVATQQQLFSSRRLAVQSELSSLDESGAGIKSQVTGLQASLEAKKAQLGFVREQLDNLRDLAKDGYIPRARLLETERTFAQLNGAIAEDIGNIGRAHRQIAEIALRRTQRQQESQKEIRTALADTQREAEQLVSRLEGLQYEMNNTEIKAPVDGTVVGSTVFTRGGVVNSGSKIMEIVPSSDPFVVEGQLPVNLVDVVHRGLKAELVFAAFNSNRTPHIPGVVTQVAADRTVDERTGAAYYKVRAVVSPEGVKMIAEHKLNIQPGMPVELFVKTGERTMMSYLLKPIIDRTKMSMTED